MQQLDAIDASEMTPESFSAHSVLVPVDRLGPAPGTSLRLQVASGHEHRLEALRAEAERVLSRLVTDGKTLEQLVNRAVMQCLSVDLRDDLWASRWPGGKSILLVQAGIYGRLNERDILEFVHRCEVEDAMERGRTVPADVVSYYRNKPRAVLSRAHVH
jgi:hypothetical protein